MSLLESLGISEDDLRDMDPDRVEAEMASGGVAPEGKYHALVTGAKKTDAKSGSEGTEIEFEFLAGPFKGSKVKDTVWKSDNAKARNRGVIMAHRLGLLTAVDLDAARADPAKAQAARSWIRPEELDAFNLLLGLNNKKRGYFTTPGKSDWCDVLYTQCIIDVIVEEYDMVDKTTKKPTGRKGKSNKLAFEGVFKLDDPRVKDVERAAGTIAVGSSNGTGHAPAHTPKDDYASLGI